MPLTPTSLAVVALGGAVGGVARVVLAAAVDRRLGGRFPWGILAVNASGAAAIGIAAGLLMPVSGVMSLPWMLFVVGVLGSYTTVSSFSLQALELWQAGRRRGAALYVAATAGGCLLAVAAGWAVGHALGNVVG